MRDIEIKNYKCFDHLKINDLKRVNLFTGKNNTGKSTILEAITLLTANLSFRWIQDLLLKRGEIDYYRDKNRDRNNEIIDNFELINSLFPYKIKHNNFNNIMSLGSDSNLVTFRFVRYEMEEVIDRQEDQSELFIKRKKIIDSDDFVNFEIGVEIYRNNQTKIFDINRIFRNYRPILDDTNSENKIYFIDSSFDNNEQNLDLWDKTTLTFKEEIVIDFLKIIEPEINRLSFIGRANSRIRKFPIPIVKLKNSGHISPLKAMGDGINRILNIILALVNVEDGILLIDEFENGLHYSVQEKLWKLIFEVAEKLNVQVFATTHSNDAITSLANVLETNKKYEAGLYRMDRKNDDIRIFPFTKEEITTAAKQKIELR